MEKLIFSFPEAAQAKDKYQIINETLELKLAFFSVFYFFFFEVVEAASQIWVSVWNDSIPMRSAGHLHGYK